MCIYMVHCGYITGMEFVRGGGRRVNRIIGLTEVSNQSTTPLTQAETKATRRETTTATVAHLSILKAPLCGLVLVPELELELGFGAAPLALDPSVQLNKPVLWAETHDLKESSASGTVQLSGLLCHCPEADLQHVSPRPDGAKHVFVAAVDMEGLCCWWFPGSRYDGGVASECLSKLQGERVRLLRDEVDGVTLK